MRVRVIVGGRPEWRDLGVAADDFRRHPPDGLDEHRKARKRESWRTERAKELTRERVRRYRERARASYEQGLGAG